MDVVKDLIQLLPNLYRTDNFFKAGETVTIPTEGDRFKLRVRPPYGTEKIFVYASTNPLGEIDLEETETSLYKVNETIDDTGTRSRSIEVFAISEEASSEMEYPEVESEKQPVQAAEFYQAEWGIVTQGE